jgi:hypothetical protein
MGQGGRRRDHAGGGVSVEPNRARDWVNSCLRSVLPDGVPPSFQSIDSAHFEGSGRQRKAIANLTMFDGETATVQVWEWGGGSYAHRYTAMPGGDCSFDHGRWVRVGPPHVGRATKQPTPTFAPLGLAWASINALGGTASETDAHAQGYVEAIDDALKALEALGATSAAWDAGGPVVAPVDPMHALLTRLAALRTDDEHPDGMSGDEAVSTLGGLIEEARELVGQPLKEEQPA